jgi:hypothetical protein
MENADDDVYGVVTCIDLHAADLHNPDVHGARDTPVSTCYAFALHTMCVGSVRVRTSAQSTLEGVEQKQDVA